MILAPERLKKPYERDIFFLAIHRLRGIVKLKFLGWRVQKLFFSPWGIKVMADFTRLKTPTLVPLDKYEKVSNPYLREMKIFLYEKYNK